jgi:hypothetical protein
MRPVTDLPNAAGGYALRPRIRGLLIRGRRAHQSRATQRTTLIRAAVKDRRVRAPARSPVLWSRQGGGQAPNGIQLGTERVGRGKPVSPRFASMLDIMARNTSPIGRHSECGTGPGFRSAVRIRVDTFGHPSRDSTLRDERGTSPTRQRLRQKSGTLTRRYGTQLGYRTQFD